MSQEITLPTRNKLKVEAWNEVITALQSFAATERPDLRLGYIHVFPRKNSLRFHFKAFGEAEFCVRLHRRIARKTKYHNIYKAFKALVRRMVESDREEPVVFGPLRVYKNPNNQADWNRLNNKLK